MLEIQLNCRIFHLCTQGRRRSWCTRPWRTAACLTRKDKASIQQRSPLMFSTRYTKPSVPGRGLLISQKIEQRRRKHLWIFMGTEFSRKHKETYAKSENWVTFSFANKNYPYKDKQILQVKANITTDIYSAFIRQNILELSAYVFRVSSDFREIKVLG